jgi:hypothetical protein
MSLQLSLPLRDDQKTDGIALYQGEGLAPKSSNLQPPVDDLSFSPTLSLQQLQLPDDPLLKQSFNHLPIDGYLSHPYRQRRFSLFCVNQHQISVLPHQYFRQVSQFNPLFGDLDREYPKLEPSTLQSLVLHRLIDQFAVTCNLTTHPVEVGVHQIRICCTSNGTGNPAPEGIHQDGYDFVGIYCVDRCNVSGGVTYLYPSKTEQPWFKWELKAGELMAFNDRAFFHFTSPIQSASDAAGFRDVFVLTAQALN